MKRLSFFILGVAFVLSSCNNISDKPVFEKLNTEELVKAIKSDTSFTNFYENIREKVDEFDDIQKAKFNDVTYRRLFKYVKFSQDTIYWKPLYEKWGKEYEKEFGIYSNKADSILNYWEKFLEENSLDKYVKVELAQIDKEYYEYIGELKEVNLGFKLTPLQGTIEQIRFNYGYKAKINGDKYFERHNCISTSPFSFPTIRYWKVGYLEKNDFAGKTVETFLRDYNLQIEVTNIRKDGVNISIDDFNIPEVVTDYFNYGDKDYMKKYYKEKVIKELIFNEFLEEWEYTRQKTNEILEVEDKLCFDFFKELYK